MGANPIKRRRRNSAELLLLGANPEQHYAVRWGTGKISQAFDSQAKAEKLLRNFNGKGEVIRVNPLPLKAERYRNPLPSATEAERAIEIREGFTHRNVKGYRVMNEPCIPAGDYAELGKLVLLAVKPKDGGAVQELGFYPPPVVISDVSRRQIYFAGGDQFLDDRELKLFTGETGREIDLGECRVIGYLEKKYHPQVDNAAAGKTVEWVHEFGEETGERPRLIYMAHEKRLLLRGGAYRVEDAGIIN